MSTQYFKNFKPIYYRFGDETTNTIFSDLSQYVDLLDQVKSREAFFEDYTILSGERPDQVSFKLYGSTEYYWTFFLLNDDLRESGWSMNSTDVLESAKARYPNRVVRTTRDISTPPYNFPVGKVVQGSVSGTYGTIIRRNLDLGHLIIDTTNTVISRQETITLDVNSNGFAQIELAERDDSEDKYHSKSLWVVRKDDVIMTEYQVGYSELETVAEFNNLDYSASSVYTVELFINRIQNKDAVFTTGEQIFYVDSESGFNIAAPVVAEYDQYNAPHHYEDASGEWVDLDPYAVSIPVNYLPVSYYDRLLAKNESVRQIKIIKPDSVQALIKEFNELMNE